MRDANSSQGTRRRVRAGGHTAARQQTELSMSKKIMSTAILAGLIFGLAAPIVEAKSTPKTKAECEKLANMKWDDAASKCVKK